MKHLIALTALLLVPAASVATAQQPVAPAANAPGLDAEGLLPMAAKNVESAARRPGVDWKSYDRILVQPVRVAFSKSWNTKEYGSFGLTTAEVTKMRTGLADLTQAVFKDVLRRGGYTVVDAPDAGVLAVKPDLTDVYVNAPEGTAGGAAKTVAMNVGEMRLALEVSDAVTGTVLARASDRKRGADGTPVRWAGSGYNRAEAERVLRIWAEQLKDALDAVRSAP